MTALQRLNPRLHLAAAVGWVVFALVTLAAVVAAGWAAVRAEDRAQADAQALLSALAAQAGDRIAAQLATRRSIVQATAIQIVASADRGNDAVRRHLEAVRAQFPEFLWLGVSDERGRITAATGGQRHGGDASALRWFGPGLQASLLGDLRAAPAWLEPDGGTIAAATSGGNGTAPALRVLVVAAPLQQSGGRTVGVLGAYLSSAWVEALPHAIVRTLGSERQLQIFVTAADGIVVLGAPGWPPGTPASAAVLGERGAYLVGDMRLVDVSGLGWHVSLRQPTDTALAPARRTGHAVFGIVLAAGLLAAAAAFAATRLLMRRLVRLAWDAEDVRRGERLALAVPPGRDEIGHIGRALAELVAHLQYEKQSLQRLNAELDARVAERTARIERLAQDSRQAAVTRERLRLARDLHDTLSHSLMALLTQIRLVRKMRTRLDAAAIDAELGRAEEVAASGLAEARAAITQMRDGGVSDIGLGAALKELLARFGERSGIGAALSIDAAAAALVDERAQTLFRIVEEALHNIERHARAKRVTVTLQSLPQGSDVDLPSRVSLEVADDGVGFDPGAPRPGHYGLVGMREQAALIGATLTVHSAPGQGTRITLRLDA